MLHNSAPIRRKADEDTPILICATRVIKTVVVQRVHEIKFGRVVPRSIDTM